jgi:hypothetical protein
VVSDLSFLNPVTIGEIIAAVIILFLLCKATGFNFSKDENGKMHFGFSTNSDKSLIKIENKLGDIQNDIVYIKEKNNEQDFSLKNISKDQLRITIFTDNLSLTEKCVAAKRYLALGGNGETKAYIENNLANTKEWEMLKELNNIGYTIQKEGTI